MEEFGRVIEMDELGSMVVNSWSGVTNPLWSRGRCKSAKEIDAKIDSKSENPVWKSCLRPKNKFCFGSDF